jgi:hypothetical protein
MGSADKDLRILQIQGEQGIEYVVKRVFLTTNLYNWDFSYEVESRFVDE